MLNPISLDQARAYIAKLDLDYLVQTMCDPGYFLPRWTEQEAKSCVELYKRFLLLCKKHNNEPLVPSKHIDECWHNHILHTEQYIQDCTHIFGHYFHHQPGKPGEDAVQYIDGYLKTKQYYLEEFGQPLDLVR